MLSHRCNRVKIIPLTVLLDYLNLHLHKIVSYANYVSKCHPILLPQHSTQNYADIIPGSLVFSCFVLLHSLGYMYAEHYALSSTKLYPLCLLIMPIIDCSSAATVLASITISFIIHHYMY